LHFVLEFNKTFYAPNTNFTWQTIFIKCIFEEYAILDKSKFSWYIYFNYSKFKDNLYLEDICNKTNQQFTLNLKWLAWSSDSLFFDENIIDCLDKNTPRETYNVLKNTLLARKDNINALEYYKKENEKHLEDMKNKFKDKKNIIDKLKIFVDYLILYFSKLISYFSTNPLKAIWWWIIFFLFFGILIIIAYTQIVFFITFITIFWLLELILFFILNKIASKKTSNVPINNQEKEDFNIKLYISVGVLVIITIIILYYFKDNRELIRYAFNPLASISDWKEIFCIKTSKGNCENINGLVEFLIRWLTFLKTILLWIITYEIVKSVRKFSRKF